MIQTLSHKIRSTVSPANKMRFLAGLLTLLGLDGQFMLVANSKFNDLNKELAKEKETHDSTKRLHKAVSERLQSMHRRAQTSERESANLRKIIERQDKQLKMYRDKESGAVPIAPVTGLVTTTPVAYPETTKTPVTTPASPPQVPAAPAPPPLVAKPTVPTEPVLTPCSPHESPRFAALAPDHQEKPHLVLVEV